MTTIKEDEDYANLISTLCELTTHGMIGRDIEMKVFDALGYETRYALPGEGGYRTAAYLMRETPNGLWVLMPHILSDFGTAIRYTIQHKYGHLPGRLDDNWHIVGMAQTEAEVGKGRVAAWAISLSKAYAGHHNALAVNPCAALVAAYLTAIRA